MDSALNAAELARARALLTKPVRPARMWPVLAAAAGCAAASLLFATAMVMAPPLTTQHVVSVERAAAGP